MPVLFGHVYLVFKKEMAIMSTRQSTFRLYACYDKQQFHLPVDNKTWSLFNNTMCTETLDERYIYVNPGFTWEYYVKSVYRSF